MLTRRSAIVSAVSMVGLVPSILPALAQDAKLTVQPGEFALGSPDAKVTIIEYASMTCSHCASFHKTTWPALKAKYVDSGKVRFVLREYPLDPLALGAFMVARCGGEKTYYPITDLLFDKQADWAFVQKPLDGLIETLRQTGLTKEKIEACLQDQTAFETVKKSRMEGEALGVNSTPTFFINGEKIQGAMTIEALEAKLKPLLGE